MDKSKHKTSFVLTYPFLNVIRVVIGFDLFVIPIQSPQNSAIELAPS